MYYLLFLSIIFGYTTASDASLCSSYHNKAIRRFEINCSSSKLNNATCFVDTKSSSCNGAYPFFFVDTLVYPDGPHTVLIIASGANDSFQFCGVNPLVVQCQETTDYSKLELKLACRVNKHRFETQCAVDGSPWTPCAARIALTEYSTEIHTLMLAIIDDDGLTYNRTVQFRGAPPQDVTILLFVTIATGTGVTFIVLISLCICCGFKKVRDNKIQAAAAGTSVAYSKTVHSKTGSDLKFEEITVFHNTYNTEGTMHSRTGSDLKIEEIAVSHSEYYEEVKR